jgi:hypothetical protein
MQRLLSLTCLFAWVACTGARADEIGTEDANMNSMLVIHPYRSEGMWVFDDARAGLVQEPFVSGADVIIDRLVESIPDAADGFTLLFSASPFPGYQAQFDWRREEHGGNWYHSPKLDMEGWLCPALFKYFEAAPRELYVQCKPRAGKQG